jgi:hypothetical protein
MCYYEIEYSTLITYYMLGNTEENNCTSNAYSSIYGKNTVGT